MSSYSGPIARRPLSLAAALLLVGFLGSACEASEQPTPSATEVPIVHVSPATTPFAQTLGADYIQQQGPLPFDLVPLSGIDARRAVESGDAAMLIDLPPAPDGWFATPLGRDAVAVIVNAQVTARNLTFEELRALFSGRAQDWSELSASEAAVRVIVPPDGDPLRERFEVIVMQNERVTTRARIAPNPARAVELVGATPGAVAIIPLSAQVSEAVRLVRVEGVLPSASSLSDGSYLMAYPVLAMAPLEPSGQLRDWLAWAQLAGSRAGQP